MTVESASFISDLNSSYPAATDAKSEGDDHLRLIKSAVKATFPNVTGAVTPTHTQLNYVTGVTSAIQTQLDAKAPLASPALTGTPTAPTAAAGTSTTQIATTAHVANAILASSGITAVLPGQTSNAGKFLTTDGTSASWVQAGIVYSARTSNTILGVADNATLIDITSGTFTQTFTAAATLGSKWYCYIRNSGTGDITLDPNASETIDGLTSFVMYPGEVRLIQCDGTVFRSLVIESFIKDFASTGTFTKPPGYSAFFTQLLGGGGAGGSGHCGSVSATYYSGGAGGAGGAYVEKMIPSDAIGASSTVTIGAGGGVTAGIANTAGFHNGAAGTAGGTTSIALLTTPSALQALGGAGGAGGNQAQTAATGGASYTDADHSSGANGAASTGSGVTTAGGCSRWGGSGGGGGGATTSAGADVAATSGGAPYSTGTGGGGAGGVGSAGTAGGNYATSICLPGTGGGGGAVLTSDAANGYAGGAGGRGSGGGGGGKLQTTVGSGRLSGAGGAGGDGYARITGIV